MRLFAAGSKAIVSYVNSLTKHRMISNRRTMERWMIEQVSGDIRLFFSVCRVYPRSHAVGNSMLENEWNSIFTRLAEEVG